jgi:transcriptional regulator with XRE-family HTH domain
MKDRILEFLRIENKSSALFAEEIGVQPSGISHIISGRNNPSLDFIIKMLSRYPSISADWLLFGRGKMYRESSIGDLFASNEFNNLPEPDKQPENKLIEGDKVHEKLNGIFSENKMEPGKIPQFNRARRIICFFDNNTFTEYFPVKETL